MYGTRSDIYFIRDNIELTNSVFKKSFQIVLF